MVEAGKVAVYAMGHDGVSLGPAMPVVHGVEEGIAERQGGSEDDNRDGIGAQNLVQRTGTFCLRWGVSRPGPSTIGTRPPWRTETEE